MKKLTVVCCLLMLLFSFSSFSQKGKLDFAFSIGSTFTSAATASLNAGIGLHIRLNDNFNIRPSFDFNQFKNPVMELFSFSADALYGTNFYTTNPAVYALIKVGLHKATAGVLESEMEPFFGAGLGVAFPLSARVKLFSEGQYCQGFNAKRGYIPVKIGLKLGV